MTTQQTKIVNHIIGKETRLLDAFQACDLSVLDELIHDSALFILPNGITVKKAMVLNNYRSGGTTMTSIKASDQKINVDDNTAVVSVNLEMTGKYNEQLIQQQFRYLRVWKLFAGGWKVIAVSGLPLSSK